LESNGDAAAPWESEFRVQFLPQTFWDVMHCLLPPHLLSEGETRGVPGAQGVMGFKGGF